MAAAVLHALGRGDEIVPRLAPAVGAQAAATVVADACAGLNCPPTTSAGPLVRRRRRRARRAACARPHRGRGGDRTRSRSRALARAACGAAEVRPPSLDACAAAWARCFDVPAATTAPRRAARWFHARWPTALAQAALIGAPRRTA
jgi:hypothetical protein